MDRAYQMLFLNLLFLAAGVVALAAALVEDRRLLHGLPRRSAFLAAAAFLCVLVNVIGLVPVRLADLPSLAVFLVAVREAARHLAAPGDRASALRCGFLCFVAVMLKLSYFPLAFVLLLAMLVLGRGPAAPGARLRTAAAFLAGFAPVALQFLNVWLHSGRIALYEHGYIRQFFGHVDAKPNVEAVVFTIPAPNAYMVKVPPDVGDLSFHVLKLFRGLFGFEWAVYMGEPSRPPSWDVTGPEIAAAYALVAGYFAAMAWLVVKGPPSLRVLALVAAALAVMNTVLRHTELRYYDLCRTALWIALACAAAARSKNVLRR